MKHGFYELLIGNERNSILIEALIRNYGIEGFGIYMYIMRLLLAVPNHILKTDYAQMSFDIGCNPNLIQDVVERSGLFRCGNNAFFSELIMDEQEVETPRISKTHKVFIKPTLEEVEQYCKDQRFQYTDPMRFYDYYESNGWKVGRTKMSNWHAKIRDWERRAIEKNTNNNNVNEHERDRKTSENLHRGSADFR